MYSVLITDDEPTIREGLRNLIEWEKYGFQVADVASNSREALQKFKQYAPNLLIMDIRMPGMSGLELIQALRNYSDIPFHVLILSGYADFAYAKKAINLHIAGYLLKPVDEEELTEHLIQLKTVLDAERSDKLRADMHEGSKKELLVKSLLASGDQVEAGHYQADAETAELVWDGYEIVLITLQGRNRREIDSAGRTMFKQACSQRFDDAERGISFWMEPYFCLMLKENLHHPLTKKKIYEELSALAQAHDMTFAAASGGSFKQLHEIALSYEKAAKLLDLRFFYAADQLITDDFAPVGIPVQHENEEPLNAASIVDKLYFAIKIGQEEVVEKLVSDWGQTLIEKGYSEESIKLQFTKLITLVRGRLLESGPEIEVRKQPLSEGILEIYKQSPYDSLKRYVIQLLNGFMPSEGNASMEIHMKKMIDLIERNSHENLKLDTLADVFNYNSAYLGKVFKKTTGEYFNTFVDKVRIRKAKELLNQGVKVAQVAEKVGFANVDYFYSKFRKYEGVSPSSFRKK
ncbi:response regulator transcription factor [Cohnella herbarum]|uniref:Response regulator transcription factor n=1 Tax=Cohnella herbarum TaxID=2728023 RepID=A0A7Z2ZK86_9BACL|nr:response regulator transcription factor [Cohnella herbarum]QJD82504.1 response regulator transcription factor [Cohnella herbarum]